MGENSLSSYNEWLKYFPFHPQVDYSKLRITKIGRYSITKPEHAEQISGHLIHVCQMIGLGPVSNLTIVDATAGIGGNTLSFLRYFKKVIAVEIQKEHFDILESNLRCYQFTEQQSHLLKLFNSDYTLIHRNVPSDIVFLDLPWNNDEIWYSKKRDLMLYLSGVPLFILVSNVFRFATAKLVALKVPYNFDFSGFIRRISTDLTIKICKIHSYYLLVIHNS